MTKAFREFLRRLPASASLVSGLCAVAGCRDVPTQRPSGELGGAIEEAHVPENPAPNPSETSTTPGVAPNPTPNVVIQETIPGDPDSVIDGNPAASSMGIPNCGPEFEGCEQKVIFELETPEWAMSGGCQSWLDDPLSPLEVEDLDVTFLSGNPATEIIAMPSSLPTDCTGADDAGSNGAGAEVRERGDAGKSDAGESEVGLPLDAAVLQISEAGPGDASVNGSTSVDASHQGARPSPFGNEGWFLDPRTDGLWLQFCPRVCSELGRRTGTVVVKVPWGIRAAGAR